MQNESITTGQKSAERKKERASKMCLTAGVCVGVMGDPAGPRGNLQVCAFALSRTSQVCCDGGVTIVVLHTHSHEHTNTYTQRINRWPERSTAVIYSTVSVKTSRKIFSFSFVPLLLVSFFAVLKKNESEIFIAMLKDVTVCLVTSLAVCAPREMKNNEI